MTTYAKATFDAARYAAGESLSCPFLEVLGVTKVTKH